MTVPVADRVLEQRRSAILSHEFAAAQALATRIVEKPALSVWMFLVPLVLLHYMHRVRVFRQGVKHAAEGLLRARRRALDLACAELGRAGDASEPWPLHTPDGMQALHAAQEAEVSMLVQHYRRLLAAPGDDYHALARAAYGSAEAYRETLNALEAVERRINAAAVEANGAERPAELFERLQHARYAVRTSELILLFGA
jgi:hypothetical protein